MQSTRLATATATTAIAIGLAAMLGGCSIIGNFVGPGDAVRDEEGQVTESGDVDVFSVTLGDCFDDESGAQADDAVYSVPIVPCNEPHDNEVFFELTLPEGEYPGIDELTSVSDEGCFAEFENFVGLPYEESVLGYFTLMPDEIAWGEGNRVVSCVIVDPGKKVTGTLAGSAY